MSQDESKPEAYAPGTYENTEGVARVASSRAVAVQLVFDGYKRVADLPADESEKPASDTEQPEAVEAGKPAAPKKQKTQEN